MSLYEKVEIFDNFGPIEVKFRSAKRTKVPVGHASFDVNRYNESLLQGEKPYFCPVSKFLVNKRKEVLYTLCRRLCSRGVTDSVNTEDR